jgi:type II secretory pathway component GspD/PulD (secretin)
MKMRLSILGLGCVLLLGRAFPAHSADGPLLDASIDLKLTKAEAGEIFKTFGQILTAEAEVDPVLAGRVLTIYLEGVKVRTALTAACEGLGCEWSFVDGKPRKLTVKAVGAPAAKRPEKNEKKIPGVDERIDIKLKQAKVADVFRTAGQILSVELSLDPKVTGEIDLDLTAVPVREVLNRICSEVGCRWSLTEGEKPSLVVTSLK